MAWAAAERKIIVGRSNNLWRGARAVLVASTLAGAPVPLAGCTAGSSYAGIPLAAGTADPELQALARRAEAGDKQAQLELGIRYEEGRNVPADRARAARLYRLAAADSGGPMHVYSPPVGRQGRGRVITIDLGPRRPGLAEARLRLEALQ